MRSFSLVASLAALLFSTEAFAQPAQPPVAGGSAKPTDSQGSQPPIAGDAGAGASGQAGAGTTGGGANAGGGTTIIVQDNGKPAKPKPEVSEDHARFRGGFQFGGGLFALPSVSLVGGKHGLNLGTVDLSSHLGVQINNMIGVYGVPGVDVLFGKEGGFGASFAVLCDFTFGDHFTVGVGPDVGGFVAFGLPSGRPMPGDVISAIAGGGYGGRIHLAAYPYVGHSDEGPRRKAFSIGLDTRILAMANAADSASTSGAAQVSVGYGPAIHVLISLGYEAM